MGDALDDLLDGLGLPGAPRDATDDLLDSLGIGVKKPHVQRRDMSQLGSDLAAAGAERAVGKVDVPDPGYLHGVLMPAATNMAGTALSGGLETARDLLKANPMIAGGDALLSGVEPGTTRELADLAQKQRDDYLTAHPDNLSAAGAFGGELGVNLLPMVAGAPAALRGLGVTGRVPTLAQAAVGAAKGAAVGAATGAPLGYLGDYGDTQSGRVDAALQSAGWGALMGGVGGAGHAPEIPRAGETPAAPRLLPEFSDTLDGSLLPPNLPEPAADGIHRAAASPARGISRTDPGEALYVARRGGEDVGSLIAAPEEDGFRVRHIAVDEASRGQGIPEQLYRAAAAEHGDYLGSTDYLGRRTPAGDAMVARLRMTAPEIFPAEPAAEPPPLTLPGMGSAIADNLYQGVHDRLVAGEPPSPFAVQPPAEAAALAAWRRGEISDVGGVRRVMQEAQARAYPAAALADTVSATTPPEHLAAFIPSTDDAIASPTNQPAVHGALAAAPEALHPEAQVPTALGDQAVRHWMLRSALGDDALADRLLHAPELQKIGDSIASIAPTIQEAGGAELRGALAQAARAVADARQVPGQGAEIARVGAILGQDAPTEVHRLASYMVEHGDKPEELGLLLHRYAELQQEATAQPGAQAPSMDALLQMANDQRQQAGSAIPLESKVRIKARPGEGGFINFSPRRFGESSPIARWFTREGYWSAMGEGMARTAKEAVNRKDFAVTAEAGRVTQLVRDFGSAMDDHMSTAPAGTSREDVLRYVRQGIEGQNDLSQVSDSLADAAMAMRSHTDALSQRYVNRPDLPPTLRAAIQGNVGSYLPRTFEAFRDPASWLKKLRVDPSRPWSKAPLLDDATAWAQREHPTWTADQAKGYALGLVMKDPSAAFALSSAQKGQIGSESRGNLIARRGLPPELDGLLGLHADPAMSFQLGSMRAIRDLETYDLHSHLLTEGSQPGPNGEPPVFVQLHDENHPVRVGGKGPLAPMYTSQEIASVIRGTEQVSPTLTPFMRAYQKVNGGVKSGMTVLNFPMGVLRNALTAPFQLLSGGHFIEAFPLKYAYDTAKHTPLAIEANLGTKRGAIVKMLSHIANSITLADGSRLGDSWSMKMKDLRPEIAELRELGVFGQSSSADNLRFYQGLEEGEEPGSRVARNIQNLGSVWAGEHDLTKHAYWKAEIHDLRWADPTLSLLDAKKMAAQRVMAVMPTRSEISPAVRAVRAAPLVSPFPTWSAETWRNAKNNIGIALDDMRNPNPRMKVIGAKRAAGIVASWYLATGGMAKGIQMLYGTAQEHADAIREFLPSYARNASIAVAQRVGGLVRYFNASPLMPQSGIGDAVMALVRGIHDGHPRDGIIDAVEEAFRPFTDTEFLVKNAMELHANKAKEGGVFDWAMDLAKEHPPIDQGRQIYEPGTPLSRTAGQVGSYLFHNDAPGTLREGERMARATGLLNNENSRGKQYTVGDELAAMGGARFSTMDLNRGLMQLGFDMRNSQSDAEKFFSSERSGSRNDPATVLAARDDANAKWKNAFEQAQKKLAAARELNVSDAAIRANLLRTGLKPNVVNQLMTGRFVGLPVGRPYREPIDFVGQDGAQP